MHYLPSLSEIFDGLMNFFTWYIDQVCHESNTPEQIEEIKKEYKQVLAYLEFVVTDEEDEEHK